MTVRALLAVIVLLGAITDLSAQGSRVVARVNGDAISELALKQRITFAARGSGMQETPDQQQRLAPQILRQMIDERLQIQHAQALGVKATDDKVNQRVELRRTANIVQQP